MMSIDRQIPLEAGWSETRPRLYADRDLWLRGTSGQMRLVLLVKWTKHARTDTVTGDLEAWCLH